MKAMSVAGRSTCSLSEPNQESVTPMELRRRSAAAWGDSPGAPMTCLAHYNPPGKVEYTPTRSADDLAPLRTGEGRFPLLPKPLGRSLRLVDGS